MIGSLVEKDSVGDKMENNGEWKLNGVTLGPFYGLSDEAIKSLKFEGEFGGVKCFSSKSCPKGTIELWRFGKHEADITGLGDS